jgi:hypothetical protein
MPAEGVPCSLSPISRICWPLLRLSSALACAMTRPTHPANRRTWQTVPRQR